ncbi:MAG: adenylate/guanylate cyclase domain-containing protein [Betaproteobacteria bacterium]|nr:adenylate/guanylate cyclase domain-containing protein [Betaproteobacteria bacterium]
MSDNRRLSVAQRQSVRYGVVVALACALAFALGRTNWVRSLENIYYDYWHVFSGVRYRPQHTAFVSIDDETLTALKDDPLAFWAPHFARAMNALGRAGVKAVGLDVLHQVSAESWLKKLDLPESELSRNYDSPLREALSRGDKILITHLVEMKGGELRLLLPPEDQVLLLPGGIHDLGIANLNPDDDKHVRHFYPVMIPDPKVPGIGFAMRLALRSAGKDPSQSEWDIAGVALNRERKSRTIGYTGPPGTIPTVSFNALLQDDALARPEVKALKGRVVIIGANNAGASDHHFTPYSRGVKADQMAGGEIHANIVETILSGRYPRALPEPVEIAYLAALLLLAVPLFMKLHAGWGIAVLIAASALVTLPAYILFRGDWVLPVAEPQLALAFGYLMTLGLRLTGEERERSRIRLIFGRYVSDEVVTKLLAEDRRPDLGGEALTVTVLFSDIRGFTTISEKLTAHEVVEMLNAYFTRVCEPILAQGGTVDKYIGDAVMAVFGSPVRHPDHARRAIRAALGMAREAEAFKQWMRERFPDRGLSEFGVGIGLHCGEAVIGDIGTPKRKEFTAIGDVVNAASRLEGVTKEMGCVILASEATVRAAGEGVGTGKFEQIRVKGKAEPLAVYEIVGLDEG